MAKLSLTNIDKVNSSKTVLNDNSDRIEAAIENTLSRDGTAPNFMDAVLDMNSNRIINLGEPVDPSDGARKSDLDEFQTELDTLEERVTNVEIEVDTLQTQVDNLVLGAGGTDTFVSLASFCTGADTPGDEDKFVLACQAAATAGTGLRIPKGVWRFGPTVPNGSGGYTSWAMGTVNGGTTVNIVGDDVDLSILKYYPQGPTALISTMSVGQDCLVTTDDDHGYSVGLTFTFSNMPPGWTSLNGHTYTVATIPSSDTFTFSKDTSTFTPAYDGGASCAGTRYANNICAIGQGTTQGYLANFSIECDLAQEGQGISLNSADPDFPCDNVTVSNVKVLNSHQGGFGANGNVTNFQWLNCTSDGAKHGHGFYLSANTTNATETSKTGSMNPRNFRIINPNAKDGHDSGINMAGAKDGYVEGMNVRWTRDYDFPSAYAGLRMGNYCANVTVNGGTIYRTYRGLRLVDTNDCTVTGLNISSTGGPGILLNSKDEGAARTTVSNIRVYDPSRFVGRTAPDDAEDGSADNTTGAYIAGGPTWIMDNVIVASDIKTPGFGTITCDTTHTTVTCKNNVDIGGGVPLFNSLYQCVEGALLFNSADALIGQIASFGDITVNATTGYYSQVVTLTGNALVAVTDGTWKVKPPGVGYYTDATGTITAATNSTTLTGTSTLFQSKLAAGYVVYDSTTTPPSLVGVIDSMTQSGAGNVATDYIAKTGNITTTRGTGTGKLSISRGSDTIFGLTSGSNQTYFKDGHGTQIPLKEGDFLRKKSDGSLIGQITEVVDNWTLKVTPAYDGLESLSQVKWKYYSEYVNYSGNGTSTNFLDGDLAEGDAIYHGTNNLIIGTVAVGGLISATQLRLTGEPQENFTDGSWCRGKKLVTFDTGGATSVFNSGDYLYDSDGGFLIGVVDSVVDGTSLNLRVGAGRSFTGTQPWIYGSNTSVIMTAFSRKAISTGHAWQYGILQKMDYGFKTDTAVSDSFINPLTCHAYGARVVEKSYTTGTLNPANFDSLTVNSGDTTTVTIDDVGLAVDGGTGNDDISTTFSGNNGVVEVVLSRNSANTTGPEISMRKSGGTIATPLIAATNAILGRINAWAHTGASWLNSGRFEFKLRQGTPSTSAMGTQAMISLVPDGSVTITELARFDHTNGFMITTHQVIDALGLHVSRNFTVATLPTGVSNYSRAFVTDSTQTLTAGIGTAVVGGGANKVPVYTVNGTAWLIG